MRRVSVSGLRPGMRLAEPIRDVHGRLILAAPADLDTGSIERLARVGVESVQVDDPRFEGLQIGPVVSDELIHGAVELFAKWGRGFGPENWGVPQACVDQDEVRRLVVRLSDGLPLGITDPVPLVMPPSDDRAAALSAVNGARLALALAAQVGLGRYAVDIAVGAFVRDVGLLPIPPGERTLPPPTEVPAEGSPLREHPTVGLSCLAHPALWSPISKKVIVQHHERLDGSGYPDGLRGETVHASAALVGAIDVYCSLVVPFAGGLGMTAEQAIDGVMSLAGQALDVKAVQALCATVGLYAPGTLVRLNTGDECVVLDAGRGTHQRPRLRMVDSGQTLDLQAQDALGLQVAAVVES